MGFHDETDIYISGPNSVNEKLFSNTDVIYHVNKNPLNPGRYRLEVAVLDDEQLEEYDHIIDAIYFEVINPQAEDKYGKIDLFGDWK